jgi:hypothetical protein
MNNRVVFSSLSPHWDTPKSVYDELNATLEITGVRVERVQDISEEDAKAEGFDGWIPCGVWTGIHAHVYGGAKRKGTCREHFPLLWDSINAKRGYGWDSNPFCWVIEFKRIKGEK